MEEPRFDDRSNNNLASLLDKALKNSQTREKEARIDDLTNIGNRRAFDQELSDSIARQNSPDHKRESDPDYVLLFFMDLNRFKLINDEYGHLAGDEALKKVAERVEEEAKGRQGKAFRFGGDEFAMLQTGKGNLSDHELQDIATRVQNNLNSNLFVEINGRPFKLGISVGCAVLKRGENKSIEDLKKEADAKMYVHKQKSRK